MSFTIIFTLEWFLRFCIFRCEYLLHPWCYFDAAIILLAWVIFIKEDLISLNVTFLRLVRFSKLLRLLRLLRSQDIFDSLKLLVASIRASVNALFWSLMILVLIQLVAALLMVQILEAFLTDENQDPHVQRQVFAYFGTFWRSMVTMFEITFANWTPSCRLLLNNVDELYGAFYLVYRCVIGFAVLMVVQSVFIQQTMKTTQLDDAYLAQQKSKMRANYSQRLRVLFTRLDNDEDGLLEWGEFIHMTQHGDVKSMLEVFELEVEDFQDLFRLLDDGDGVISIDEFVSGVEHIKGTAREIDVMELKQMIRSIQMKLGVTAEEAISRSQLPLAPSGLERLEQAPNLSSV